MSGAHEGTTTQPGLCPASVGQWRSLRWRPLHARRAVLHDLDAALPGRLRRGRCACPLHSRYMPASAPGLRLSRLELIGGSVWPHRRPLRICRARLHFADRLRAGAGRRSGSGWRQGRVRWGRPLLSRPRGAVPRAGRWQVWIVGSSSVLRRAWSRPLPAAVGRRRAEQGVRPGKKVL